MKKLVIGITASQSIDLLNGQLKYFKTKRYIVYLMAPNTEEVRKFCIKENVALLPINIKRQISPFSDLKTLFQIRSILKKVQPDIVNLGTPKVSLLGMMAAKWLDIPKRIYTCRGFRFEHENGKLRKFLIGVEKVITYCAHQVICISPSVKEIGIQEGIFTEQKAKIIAKGSSNGINLKLFNPDNYTVAFKNQLKGKLQLKDQFVFGYVGRLVDRKGIQELYKAFDLLYQERQDVSLLVVGRPYYDQIANPEILDQYYEHPGITMMGLQPPESIPEFLTIMDTFVLPAYWEGFGNVLIQAAAMGVPVLSNKVTGCRDSVNHGFNGELVESHDPQQFKAKMLEFLQDKEKLESYGKNGITWAQNFKPEIIWEGLEEIYQTK